MTKQKTPHTQTQQNVEPEQTDLEKNEEVYEADGPDEHVIYQDMEGAETGDPRTPREIETRNRRHRTEPERVAHEGKVSARTQKGPVQGVTSHSASEEAERQRKVVSKRQDAQAGVNQSKGRGKER
jgi:hypothetical protein